MLHWPRKIILKLKFQKCNPSQELSPWTSKHSIHGADPLRLPRKRQSFEWRRLANVLTTTCPIPGTWHANSRLRSPNATNSLHRPSENLHGHPVKRSLRNDEIRDANFVQACAVETDVEIWQRNLCASLRIRKPKSTASRAPQPEPGLDSYRKYPQVWTHCLGNEKIVWRTWPAEQPLVSCCHKWVLLKAPMQTFIRNHDLVHCSLRRGGTPATGVVFSHWHAIESQAGMTWFEVSLLKGTTSVQTGIDPYGYVVWDSLICLSWRWTSPDRFNCQSCLGSNVFGPFL